MWNNTIKIVFLNFIIFSFGSCSVNNTLTNNSATKTENNENPKIYFQKEGLEIYKKMFHQQFMECGDSYFTKHHYEYRDKSSKYSPEENFTRIVRLKELSFHVDDKDYYLDATDKLNRIQYKGVFYIHFLSVQRYEDGKEWSIWLIPANFTRLEAYAQKTDAGWEFKHHNSSVKIADTLNKKEDNFRFYVNETFQKIDCSKLPPLQQ